jgi:hypothetical protein
MFRLMWLKEYLLRARRTCGEQQVGGASGCWMRRSGVTYEWLRRDVAVPGRQGTAAAGREVCGLSKCWRVCSQTKRAPEDLEGILIRLSLEGSGDVSVPGAPRLRRVVHLGRTAAGEHC